MPSEGASSPKIERVIWPDGQPKSTKENHRRKCVGDSGHKSEVKTSVAFDEDRNKYLATDIDKSWFQVKFNGTPDKPDKPGAPKLSLHDVSYDPVTPIQSHERAGGIRVRAHFRLQGNGSGDRIGGGEPDDQTHEKVIESLLAALNAAGSNVAFTTTVFGDENAHHKIWRCPKGSKYEWVREPETRQWFENKKYIQPDLYGFDVSRRSAGPNNKSIVVEVIRTHEPEAETWERLVELSKVNHLVMFYFCHPTKSKSWLGNVSSADPVSGKPLRLRTELYLLDGNFHKQGKIFRPNLSGDKLRVAILEEFKRIKKL